MSYSAGHKRGSYLALLWLWSRLAAAAPIWPQAWELLYATSSPPPPQKRKKKKSFFLSITFISPFLEVSSLNYAAVVFPRKQRAGIRTVPWYPTESLRRVYNIHKEHSRQLSTQYWLRLPGQYHTFLTWRTGLDEVETTTNALVTFGGRTTESITRLSWFPTSALSYNTSCKVERSSKREEKILKRKRAQDHCKKKKRSPKHLG